jgi:hypothetical protein
MFGAVVEKSHFPEPGSFNLKHSPRWSTLNEPDGTLTRTALRLWFFPRDGISTLSEEAALHLQLGEKRHVQVAPHERGLKPMR